MQKEELLQAMAENTRGGGAMSEFNNLLSEFDSAVTKIATCSHGEYRHFSQEREQAHAELKKYDTALRATITRLAQELEQVKKERDAFQVGQLEVAKFLGYGVGAQLSLQSFIMQQLAAMTRERDELNVAVASGIRHRQEYVERIDALVAELAASQARCREMEAQWHYAATHDADMDYVKEIAQLQATLAAREAEVDRLKLAQQHSIQDECEAEQRLIDAGISDYEDGWQGEYRGLLTQIDLCIKERDAAAQELEQAKGNYAIQKAAADDYEQQLAASQARCREMEEQVEKKQALLLRSCRDNIEDYKVECKPTCDDYVHADDCPSAHPGLVYDELRQQLAQLQATLAARENELCTAKDQIPPDMDGDSLSVALIKLKDARDAAVQQLNELRGSSGGAANQGAGA